MINDGYTGIFHGNKQLVLSSLLVHWKLNHLHFAFVDLNIAQNNFCQ